MSKYAKNILKDQIYPNCPEIVRKNCTQNVPNDPNAQIKLSGSICSKKPLQDALNILKGRNISRDVKGTREVPFIKHQNHT